MARRQQSKREKALRRYFARRRGRFVWGGLLLLAGAGSWVLSVQAGEPDLQLLGAALILLGLLAMVIRRARPSDEQVDAWLKESVDRIVAHSRAKLNLGQLAPSGERGPAAEPLTVLGPILWPTGGIANDDLVWREGKDQVVRFGVYRLTVIHLTERHLAAYSCDYDFIRDVPLNEETQEYHYIDIVGVSTREQASSLTLPSGVKLTSAQQFSVSVTSGEALQVFVDAAKLSKVTGSDKIPETGAERAVSVIRAMLRDKKEAPYRGAPPPVPEVAPAQWAPPAPIAPAPTVAYPVESPTLVEQICPKCGAPLQAGAKFCMACGAAQACLVAGDQRYPIPPGGAEIGRASGCTIQLADPLVSGHHARLDWRGGACTLTDLGSTNGTFVNGQRVERQALSPGDEIRVGHTTLRFQA